MYETLDKILKRRNVIVENDEALLEKVKIVIRKGEKVKRKIPLRKPILSPAQKQALRKARMKSNTATAKFNRGRSLKKRKSFGLK